MKLYVLAPDPAYAERVRAAGATPLPLLTDAVDGHPVARGLAEVKRLVAEGKKPLAVGGLDRAGLAAAMQAGAAGVVLHEQLLLLRDSPLSDADRAALQRLTLADFAQGDATLPGGLKVGRDALLAPFLARRAPDLATALALLKADAASAPASAPAPAAPAPRPAPAPAPVAPAAPAAPQPPAPKPATAPAAAASHADVLREVTALVSEKTGYPADLLAPDLDLEADLGIDTVKQAEIFGQLRERYQVPRDDSLKLKDYPTLAKVADYMASRASGAPMPAAAPAPRPAPAPQPAAAAPVVLAPPAQETRVPVSVSSVSSAPPSYETQPLPEAVAIIGVGAVLPKASDAKRFWQNVLDKVDAITEVPPDRWDASVHYDPDPSKEDKTYTKIGGFVTDFTFDPLKFRIPPSTAKALDPVQQMALTAAAEALADAGYDRRQFDRSRCAVILGNSLGGERKDETNKRMHLAEFTAVLRARGLPENDIKSAEDAIKRTLPAITEDTMPGELSNVIAGRLANVLNLTGKNLTTDAACASSHAALDTAVKAILGGEADMVLCGGADRSMDPGTYVKFSKIGALSPTGSTPFDARADGFVMGEGVAMLLLKRLSDAIRDGDRIYAVIRGMGSSSDGKGKGITAPNPDGQKLAVKRAFDVAQVMPRHVQLVEAHGTSTKVGDVVEVESLAALFQGVPPGSVALGSVKSQIGHLKSAAGAAGILKAALALHHKVLPPSINFQTPNPNIKWGEVPFYVNTDAKPWPATPAGEPRRAAVSAFGFGGTNFHVLLEEYVPEYHARARAAASAPSALPAPSASPAPSARPEIEGELVVLGADTPERLAQEALRAARAPAAGTLADSARRMRTPGAHAKPHRLAVGATDHPTLVGALETAAAMVPDPRLRPAIPLKAKGAAYGEGPRPAGKVAFLFPGQGSQYANMCADLAKRYPVVRATFEEADRVLEPLIGRKLTELIFVDANDKEAVKRAEEALRQTEVTQPAMLAADVAIHRLLLEHGVRPDMVGGHSLGEYAALVAAGVLSFQDALLAVSARGKEMANVHVEDKGLMASFSCGPEQAEQVLRQVEGYVVCANKNCPVQTVVAGETKAVQKAMELAAKAGIQVVPLNVSAAFHTRIVAPASEPLRRVLERLDFRAPQVTVYTNVDATPYPADPSKARDILAKQVAAPVEWIAQLEAMHAAGARVFVEVGPKRALAGFVDATLGQREGVVSLMTNHPKQGDLPSFYAAAAKLAALGFDLGLPAGEPAPVPSPAAASAPAPAAHPTQLPAGGGADFAAFQQAVQPALEAALRAGYATFQHELERLREAARAFDRYGLVPCDVVVSGASMGLPGRSRRVFDDSNFDRIFQGENRIDRLDPAFAERFLEKDIVRLVKDGGEPRMEAVKDAAEVIKLAGRRGDLDVERDYGVDAKLAKTLDTTSKLALAAAYEALRDAGIPVVREQVVTRSGKTLPGKWVLPREMQDDTGVVFASAFPGYDNLVQEVSKQLAKKYGHATLKELDGLYHEMLEAVPPERRARLSKFYAEHAHKLHEIAGDERGIAQFNRHFLFSVLSLGHAELAETLHARGPNTQVNAACASTTQALAIAEDWMRTGRARRVVVVGADDVTSENLMEWIGSGFLASGAATTAANVEEGALPFDRRRHGMIIGMGAVGLVLERREDVEARGMMPVARLVATRIANSAYHGSRLHVDHIAGETRAMVETAARRLGVPVAEMAPRTLFVSHETYTPARGGSASAEAAALRAAFGAAASQVLVTNTKGFTGHAMGAGLEDALAVKALQFNRAPPIANLRDVDPEFADLTLSRGGAHDRRYAVRFSAGFGSQLALALFEKMADGPERVRDKARHQAFLDRAAGAPGARTEMAGRVYRIAAATTVPVREPAGAPTTVAQPVPAPPAMPQSSPAVPAPPAMMGGVPAATRDEVLARVVALVGEKTGYPADVLDPTLDMEADLGIDTVKQAEIFGQLRDQFAIPREEGLTLKEYPTLAKVADYMFSRLSATGSAAPREASPPVGPAHVAPAAVAPNPQAPRADATHPLPGKGPGSSDEVLARVTQLIASRTGYPPEMLDPTLDMEADLGIDTVKQAEIFGEVREAFGIPRLEGISLKDYPTIGHVAGFVSTHAGRSPAAQAQSDAAPLATANAPSVPAGRLVRRVPRVAEAPSEGQAKRSAFVVGHGPLAEALRHRFHAQQGQVAIVCGAQPRELFAWARAHAADLEAGRAGVLVVTEMGGDQGVTKAVRPEQGGLTGMAKALAAEFPAAWVRALDLDPEEDVAKRTQHVEAELRVQRSLVEVGRTAKGRVVVRTITAGETDGATPQLPEGTVVVATGGARGITAEALRALAPQRPVLVLVGRTPAPAQDEPAWTDARQAELREKAKQDLAAKGERVTPVAIERWLAPHKGRAEVAATLRALREAGAKAVEYHPCDVADADALAKLLAGVRERHGAVHAVLHAAGVEESKRLADKDEAAFDRAWRPKAEAALHLARLTEKDPLRFFVMFGSVAGRYGNAAQADYSAANDALAKLARALRGRGVAATVMCWGPWGETGMATRGSTLKVLGAAGVEPLTTEEGVRAFLSELARLDEPEVVLAKSLGQLEAQSHGPALALRADEPALDHHRVEGTPYLAGVMGLQAMGVHAPFPVKGFEDVRFAYPIKLLRDQPVEATVHVEGKEARITTVPPGPRKEPRTHFTARLLESVEPAVGTRPVGGRAWSFGAIYPPFFHGPAFQVLARATRVAWDGIEVEGRQPADGIPPEAATLEGALQALGLWGLAVAGRMALPESVGRVALYGPFEPGATTYRVHDARLEDGRVKGDVECVLRGVCVATLSDIALVVTGPAQLAEAPAPLRSERVGILGAQAVRVPVEDARALLARPALWERYLGAGEREALQKLAVDKRREEWLAATLAAKEALRAAGDRRAWPEMEIARGDDRAPVAHGARGVTLSHAGGVALAAVFDLQKERVGVDVETVEYRPPSWEEEAFSPEERARLPGGPAREQAATLAWCVKESVLKALGTGLSVDLHDVRVTEVDGGFRVDLSGAAQERYAKLDARGLAVEARREGRLAVACARLTLA